MPTAISRSSTANVQPGALGRNNARTTLRHGIPLVGMANVDPTSLQPSGFNNKQPGGGRFEAHDAGFKMAGPQETKLPASDVGDSDSHKAEFERDVSVGAISHPTPPSNPMSRAVAELGKALLDTHQPRPEGAKRSKTAGPEQLRNIALSNLWRLLSENHKKPDDLARWRNRWAALGSHGKEQVHYFATLLYLAEAHGVDRTQLGAIAKDCADKNFRTRGPSVLALNGRYKLRDLRSRIQHPLSKSPQRLSFHRMQQVMEAIAAATNPHSHPKAPHFSEVEESCARALESLIRQAVQHAVNESEAGPVRLICRAVDLDKIAHKSWTHYEKDVGGMRNEVVNRGVQRARSLSWMLEVPSPADEAPAEKSEHEAATKKTRQPEIPPVDYDEDEEEGLKLQLTEPVAASLRTIAATHNFLADRLWNAFSHHKLWNLQDELATIPKLQNVNDVRDEQFAEAIRKFLQTMENHFLAEEAKTIQHGVKAAHQTIGFFRQVLRCMNHPAPKTRAAIEEFIKRCEPRMKETVERNEELHRLKPLYEPSTGA